jgi:hypothetical protein
MATDMEKLRKNTRRIRDSATRTVEVAWHVTRGAMDSAVEKTKESLKGARERQYDLETKARKLAAKAADKVEKASHEFKEKQQSKRRKAQGKKGAAVRARKASGRGPSNKKSSRRK